MTPDHAPDSGNTESTGIPSSTGGEQPRSPWVLIDDTTISQTVSLLERLTDWLQSADPHTTRSCAAALSLDETDDPQSIAGWADCLAARLQHCAEADEL